MLRKIRPASNHQTVLIKADEQITGSLVINGKLRNKAVPAISFLLPGIEFVIIIKFLFQVGGLIPVQLLQFVTEHCVFKILGK